MNHPPAPVLYHHPQTAFQQTEYLGNHDPRRYGMTVATTNHSNTMQGGLMAMDPTQQPHMGGAMITSTTAPNPYPIAYRAPEHAPFANNIYVTADGQRISQMGGGGGSTNMPMVATATPHYAYTGGAAEMPPDSMAPLPPSLNSSATQGSFLSQSEREEELLLQLLIARRNRTQQTGIVANDSLADELMRLRQSRGYQGPGCTMGANPASMNQSVMDTSLGGSMPRQFVPDLNGRIDRNPTRLVDARTQDMMDLSQRMQKQRTDGKFGPLDLYTEEAPPKKQKRAHRKKPADMPRRPLSAYNLFFSEERERILKEIEGKEVKEDQSETNEDEGGEGTSKPKAFLRPLVATEKKRRPHRKTHGKISFQTLARMVGERWKGLTEERRKYYQELAEEDAKRQKAAMEEYHAKQSASKQGGEAAEKLPEGEVEEDDDDDEDEGEEGIKEKESPTMDPVAVDKEA